MKTSIKIKKTKEVLSLITSIAFSNVPCWYDAARRDLHMDLIIPKNRQGHVKCPVVIWICGGAYMVVDHSVWMPEMVRFARAGYVVASVEYRTSNEAQFPAQLVDVKSAVRYLKAHSEQYCIDPDRIFVMGESAGGTMACLIGATADQKEYDQGDYLEYDSSVKGVVDFYGLVDLDAVACNACDTVPAWTMQAFLGAGYKREQAEKASAIKYINEKTPPFMILHGTEDPTVPIGQSRNLYETLQKNGIRADYYEVEGAAHGDDVFYEDGIVDKILDFLKSLQ
ncbi:MAG: alpha/beta hydrolase, partial [Acetatifactor sp.]|nr:alpha/beta hydrolase [Acetatifactor sp.]